MSKYDKIVAEHKSSGCSLCGYNKSISALCFHHKDPSEKEANVSSLRQASMKRIVSEIEKCIVVCANCHCELHENDENFSFGKQKGDVVKKRITIRLDEDIIEWFKMCGSSYQTAINNALRPYVDADFDKTMMGREIRILSKTKVRQDTIPKLKEQMAAMQTGDPYFKPNLTQGKMGKK